MHKKNILLLSLFFNLITACSDKINESSNLSSVSGGIIVGNLDWLDLEGVEGLGPSLAQGFSVGILKVFSGHSRQCNVWPFSSRGLMTSYHCLQNLNSLDGVSAYFSEGLVLSCTKMIAFSEELDYALLDCGVNLGDILSILPLDPFPEVNGEVYLLQNNCLQLEEGECVPRPMVSAGLILRNLEQTIHTTVDSLRGSSGAPIFSLFTNKVIGLHRSGVSLEKNGYGLYNVQTKLSAILKDIKQQICPHDEEICHAIIGESF